MNITVRRTPDGAYIASREINEYETASARGDSPRTALLTLADFLPDPRHGDGEYCPLAADTLQCSRSHRWG